MADLLDFDAALAGVLEAVTPLTSMSLALADAAGYCLAAPLAARLTQPPFAASAMDGYAVRADDIPATLELIGTAEAGSAFSGLVRPGSTVRIFTGAPLPEGADTVVMQEEVVADGNAIRFAKPVSAGLHVRPAGNDFREGDVLLAEGARLNAAGLALAAAAGHGHVAVHRRPVVAALATGDELVPPGTLPAPSQIIASNASGLQALLASASARFDDLGIAGDTETALRDKLQVALESDADVILTTGGASVGDKDLVRPVLQSLGVQLAFWRIAMRPGKPLMFGRFGDKLIFGLPGNPVSALVTARLLVLPALRALAGDADPVGTTFKLPLAAAVSANGPRRHFLRGRLLNGAEGTMVQPVTQTDSAHLSSFAGADCLIVHRENSPALDAGALVDVLPLF